MNINPNISGYGVEYQQALNELQEINQATIEQLSNDEEVSDVLSTSTEALGDLEIDPQNPRLPNPNQALLSSVPTNPQLIDYFIQNSEAMKELIFSVSYYSDLVNAGIPEAEIESMVKSILVNNSNSPYTPDALVKRAMGEIMHQELQAEPNAELETEWFNLRAELLSQNEPTAKLLIQQWTQHFIQEGNTPERAAELANKAAVLSVDQTLSEEGVITPFYGMHPAIDGAVLAAIKTSLEGVENAQFKAALAQDLVSAGNMITNGVSGATQVENPEQLSQDAIDALAAKNEGHKEYIEELLVMLQQVPMNSQEKVAILEFMKFVAIAINNMDAAIAQMNIDDTRLTKSEAQMKIETAVANMENKISEIKEAMRKLREMQEKVEKMKNMFGVFSVLADVMMSVMMAVFGVIIVAVAPLLAATVTVLVSYVIGAQVFLAALGILGMIIGTIIAIILFATGAGIPLAIVVEVIVIVVLAVITIVAEILVMIVTAIIGVIALILGAILLMALLVLALLAVSKALTEHTNVTEDLADSFGPALLNLLDQVGIDVDLDTCYWICAIAPIVIVAVILVAVPLILILAIVLVPIIAVIGTPLMLSIPVVFLAALAVAWIALLAFVVVASLLPSFVAIFAFAAALLVAIVLLLVAVLFWIAALIVALLPVILVVLLAIILAAAGLIAATLLPAIIMTMLQWIPMFLKKAGAYKSIAEGLGEAMGLSEEDIEGLELALTGMGAMATASSGQQVNENVMSGPSAEEQEEMDAMGTEYGMETEMEGLEATIDRISKYIGMLNGPNITEEYREEYEKKSIGSQAAQIEELMKVMKQVKIQLQKVLDAMTKGGTGEGMDLGSAQQELSTFIQTSLTSALPSLKKILPEDLANMATPENTGGAGGDIIGSLQSLAVQSMPDADRMRENAQRDLDRYLAEEEEEKYETANVFMS